MSYADARLDLAGCPVVCLTGSNGAGKSALLDGLSWALWEEGRGSSDDLVRLGEREMWVEVVLEHEGRQYRIKRSRHKQGKAGGKGISKGNLDFQVQTQNGSWQSMTAASMKETTKNISDLLRMDFDTFINSAYLKQGRAEEFTTRAPQERKQVLCEILGLSFFDRLQEEARAQAKRTKVTIEAMELSLGRYDGLLAEMQQIDAEEAVDRESFENRSEESSGLEREIAALEASQVEGRLHAQNLARQKDDLAINTRQAEKLKAERDRLLKRDSELNLQLADMSDLKIKVEMFQTVRQKVEQFDNLFAKQQDLQETKIQLVNKLANLRSRLEVQLEGLKREEQDALKEQERLDKELQDVEKVKKTYAEYRASVAEEAKQLGNQEAFNQLSKRVNELNTIIGEQKIRLEVELGQKERQLKDFAEIVRSNESLDREGLELAERREELDKYETEFELVEKQGITFRNDIESANLKIQECKQRQIENLKKVEELKQHEHSPLCPLCSAPIVDRAKVIDSYLDGNRTLDREIDELEARVGTLEEERQKARKKYMELKRELDQRKELDRRIGQYNEKLSSLDRARTNFDKLKSDCDKIKDDLAGENFAQVEKESLINVKAELIKLDFDPAVFASLQSQIRLKRHIEGRYQQLERDLVRKGELAAKIPDLVARIAALTQELQGETYGQQERAHLAEILASIKTLAYDREEHARLKKELGQLFEANEKSQELSRAMAEKPLIESQLLQLQDNLNEVEARRTALAAQVIVLERNVSDLPAVDSKIAQLRPALSICLEARAKASEKLAVLANRRERLSQEVARMDSERNMLLDKKKDLEDLQFLSEAFGKKGIQAVIIENAIPEIEAEANRILSRLTENRMHIALVTQAKTKAGTISETLEIVIGDEVGTRNYELYSGGEAFKVNFALRIALSRLLARRAGAKLETLIIDEGFGSQDDGSRDKLVKAIRLIQQDFSRVIIITHIQDVREMFPVQILVEKKHGISALKLIS
ncbi:MAG: SMC family ATPase [Candidatus Melainabacteria bacterium]|nr:SMC family ATPase [Candidatus Melainabacteria bacterium]